MTTQPLIQTQLPFVTTNINRGVRTTPSSKEFPILYGGRKASHQLNIVVVGCGLGGLAAAHTLSQAGHKVTMLEQAPAIGEVGAGIQVSPNITKLLARWGLGNQLSGLAVVPEAMSLRRWDNGKEIGRTEWGAQMMTDFGAPYYHLHRADFHQLLYNLAAPNMTLRLNARVTSVDPEGPSCTLSSGEVIKCDLIVGADGIKSVIRNLVAGRETHPVPSGDACYRAMIPIDHLLSDPILKPLVDTPEMFSWLGPGRHIIGYCMRGMKEYNLVLVDPDSGELDSWKLEDSAEKIRASFAGWEPRIQRLLAGVPSSLRWKLMDHEPLTSWIHPSNKVVLLGDSAHATLPYRAQGAAMAVEDAAVLGNLFSRVRSPAQVPALLKAYEDLRLTRTTKTTNSARTAQYTNHLDDGPEQQARDLQMAEAMRGHSLEGNVNQWADRTKRQYQYGYDADEEAERWWIQNGAEVEELVLQARM